MREFPLLLVIFSFILFVSNVLIKYWGKNLPYPEVPSGVMSGV